MLACLRIGSGPRYKTRMLIRVALAQLAYPRDPDDAVARVTDAIERGAASGASLVAFPECYVPGYRGLGYAPPAPDARFLKDAWDRIARATARARVTAVVGTERVEHGQLFASVLVIGSDGATLGFQDKVQIDPDEDNTYCPGERRHLFSAGELRFGVVICHEGWRYPETTRWAVRRGAHVVFHPHLHTPVAGFTPTHFGEASNTFHERAVLCRAAENTAYFASINYAVPDAATTSAVASPDGTLLAHHPYGKEGLLVVDLDLSRATGHLARRYRPMPDA